MDALSSSVAPEHPVDPPGALRAALRDPQQLDATVEHLERLCGRLEQAELRFKQLTAECEGVLQGLVAVDRRHTSVIAGLDERLGDWCHLEGRLLEESAKRIEQFERAVGHEWSALRQLHEEPIAEMRAQADQLRLACLEAARLARNRLDSAEAAYTSYTADLERRMSEWTREITKAARTRAITDGGAGDSVAAKAASMPVEPWPLEGVAQLHQELRAGPGPATVAPPATPTGASPATPVVASPATRVVASPTASAAASPVPPSAETPRLTALQAGPPFADAPRQPHVWRHRRGIPRRGRPAGRGFRVAAVLAAVFALAVGAYAFHRAASQPAAQAAAPSSRPASRDSAGAGRGTAQAEAPRPGARAVQDSLTEAQRVAERAGAMVEILAAADLRRYALAGEAASPAAQPYGQVLWSRSRGLAASASRLPALAAGKVYRLWIVPDGPPVAAGDLVPDAAGRASLVVNGPLKLPVPVSIRVTLEDRGEVMQPRGPVCLVRVPAS